MHLQLGAQRQQQEMLRKSIMPVSGRMDDSMNYPERVIVNVSSNAAFQPGPYMAVYGATKAFVLSFSEALWGENRKRGVQVLVLCPGSTETAFFEAAGSEGMSSGALSTLLKVAQSAFKALERNRSYVVEGTKNYLACPVIPIPSPPAYAGALGADVPSKIIDLSTSDQEKHKSASIPHGNKNWRNRMR